MEFQLDVTASHGYAVNYEPMAEDALAGYSQRRSRFRESQILSATEFIADLMTGRVPSYFLREALQPETPAVVRSLMSNYPGIIRVSEAMTTSDFPNLTGDVLDRMLLQRYRAYPSPWRRFMKINPNLRDFRTVDRFQVDGLEGQWESVPEQDEIKYGALSETAYSYAPKKYAKGAKISFEAIMNDDLSAFDDIPNRLGLGGARTISKFATGLYVDTNGPHASLYTVGNANIVTGNPALSVTALGTAWTVLSALRDADGEPIVIESVILVVPPALEITARNIVNATAINMTNTGGISGQEMQVNNWFGSRFEVVVDPYIPVVAATADGNTMWALFANPSIGASLEMGFVRGFAEPQLYQKLSNTARVGGGVDQAAGDFLTMSQEYKGVVAFGGARLNPKFTVASEGDGS